MLKAVIVDLDGTLVETRIDWEELRRRVREVLGVGPEEPLKPLATAVLRLARGDRLEEALRLIEDEELRSIGGAEYPEGVKEVLESLRRVGVKVAVVTLRSRRTAEPLLEALGIEGLVDTVVTRDEFSSRAEQLLEVLRRLGVRKDEVVFIGDWVGDELAAREVGVKVFIVKDASETVKVLRELVHKIH